MICYPHCKINLGLNIQNRREDGFHNLETIFYPIPLCDILEVVPSEKSEFEMSFSGLKVDGNLEDNLVYKAYLLVQQKYQIPIVKVHLHKVIPMGAGLGGGSSDAAFTVKILDKIFNLKMSFEDMKNIVAPLGSDCVFFLQDKPVFAKNTGNDFEEIDLNLKGKWIVILKSDIHINTAWAYKDILNYSLFKHLPDISSMDIKEWRKQIFNDFEFKVFERYPEVELLKQKLYEHGAQYSAMSGSGSAVFGIFDQKPAMEKFENIQFTFSKQI